MNKSGNKLTILWKNFQAGDKVAFAELYNLHVDGLYRYGTKLCPDDDLVKDAIHEVFLDLYLKRANNKTDPDNLKFYLILALKRNLIRRIKRNRKLADESEVTAAFHIEYSIENTIIENEEKAALNQRVKELLKNLTDKQKEVLYLRFNESVEYPEIARIMNISVESVRKQVYRALSAIREQFGDRGLLLWMMGLGAKTKAQEERGKDGRR